MHGLPREELLAAARDLVHDSPIAAAAAAAGPLATPRQRADTTPAAMVSPRGPMASMPMVQKAASGPTGVTMAVAGEGEGGTPPPPPRADASALDEMAAARARRRGETMGASCGGGGGGGDRAGGGGGGVAFAPRQAVFGQAAVAEESSVVERGWGSGKDDADDDAAKAVGRPAAVSVASPQTQWGAKKGNFPPPPPMARKTSSCGPGLPSPLGAAGSARSGASNASGSSTDGGAGGSDGGGGGRGGGGGAQSPASNAACAWARQRAVTTGQFGSGRAGSGSHISCGGDQTASPSVVRGKGAANRAKRAAGWVAKHRESRASRASRRNSRAESGENRTPRTHATRRPTSLLPSHLLVPTLTRVHAMPLSLSFRRRRHRRRRRAQWRTHRPLLLRGRRRRRRRRGDLRAREARHRLGRGGRQQTDEPELERGVVARVGGRIVALAGHGSCAALGGLEPSTRR